MAYFRVSEAADRLPQIVSIILMQFCSSSVVSGSFEIEEELLGLPVQNEAVDCADTVTLESFEKLLSSTHGSSARRIRITAGMSGVANPMVLARRVTKTPGAVHAYMLPEEEGHDRSIP